MGSLGSWRQVMDPFQEQFSVMLPDGSIANDGAFTTVPAGKSRHRAHIGLCYGRRCRERPRFLFLRDLRHRLFTDSYHYAGWPQGVVIGSHTCRAFARPGDAVRRNCYATDVDGSSTGELCAWRILHAGLRCCPFRKNVPSARCRPWRAQPNAIGLPPRLFRSCWE
jgi:hypothetical protein